MARTLAENLLFASLAINAALLIFIAGVLRKVMNDMQEAEFKHFLELLVRHSKRSPFMLTVLNIPFFGAIPYCYFYGFANRWLLSGLALWLVAGAIGKTMKLPIYKVLSTLEVGDLTRLREERQRLNAGNVLQAILNSVAVLLAFVSLVR